MKAVLLIGFVLASIHFIEAHQPKRLVRIGYLVAGSPEGASARIEAFREGLHALGYIGGKDILIEYQNAAGKPEQVPPNAAELVHLKVDNIVTAGPTDMWAAKHETSTISIVTKAEFLVQTGRV